MRVQVKLAGPEPEPTIASFEPRPCRVSVDRVTFSGWPACLTYVHLVCLHKGTRRMYSERCETNGYCYNHTACHVGHTLYTYTPLHELHILHPFCSVVLGMVVWNIRLGVVEERTHFDAVQVSRENRVAIG